MIVKLQLMTDENNKIRKSPVDVTTYNDVTLKNPSSVVNPDLIIADASLDPTAFNYVYIPAWHRWYFVHDVTSVNDGLWNISCHCDVLMSFSDTILDNNAIVSRQEYNYDAMLSDPRIKVKGAPYTQTLKFPRGFTGSYTYCLVVSGNEG